MEQGKKKTAADTLNTVGVNTDPIAQYEALKAQLESAGMTMSHGYKHSPPLLAPRTQSKGVLAKSLPDSSDAAKR